MGKLRAKSLVSLTVVIAAGGYAAACGGGSHAPSAAPTGAHDAGTDGTTMNVPDAPPGDTGAPSMGDGSGPALGSGTLASVAIMPAMASIESLNNAVTTQPFTLVATYSDMSTVTITNSVTWTATEFPVGSIDGTGIFTARGSQGGAVVVTGSYMGMMATAQLTVKLHLTANSGALTPAQELVLTSAAAPDTTATWSYPYDGTVFPRGLLAPELQWGGAGASDLYYVHLSSPTFELEDFAVAPMQRYDFVSAAWDQFTSSTTGAAELTVARLSGATPTAATTLVDEHYTVAPASMRGTIYYWAINTARVMRIKPGAQADDMFGGSGITCPSCHTVSANGSQLVMNTGTWPNETTETYGLQASQANYTGLAVTNGASAWAQGGLSADGQVLVENWAPLRGNIGNSDGAFNANTGAKLMNTGLEGIDLWMPAFAPDDKLLAYVQSNGGQPGGDLHAFDWSETAQQATNDRLIVAAGPSGQTNVMAFPTVSPDHQWVIYQRSNALGSLGNNADLYMASVAQPGTEVSLDNLNGATYPFAAGDRDRHYNFEPTFAPVAAGGYFWVVFHSRRTYGNESTGPAYVAEGNGTKQLWVAAIDQNPVPGKDASHPGFWLPGQDVTTLNMRGYWALDPCKGDGLGCQTGTDCCGGYCEPPDGGVSSVADAGADAAPPLGLCSSQSSGCSNDGDHCSTAADCCGAATGTVCINSVCSEPTPN